jgi:serine phosphatase RsbU (regulator of sigma subunit)/CheY-like chemotaxis protein
VSERASEPSSGDDVTLLLVDDTEQNLVALAAVLEPLGHRLLQATSGEQALRHLLTEDVAVILLDVRMPGMDGLETARHIKGRERTRDIPIVFLTAFGDDTSGIVEGLASGAVDYLSKPVDPALLRAKVQVLVDLHQRTSDLRRERLQLAQALDAQFAAESRILRSLTEAALAINSTLALDDMLRVINESARRITRSNQSETILLSEEGVATGGRSRSVSPKYAGWASQDGPDLSPLHELVWRSGGPVRMTAKDVDASFGRHGLMDVAAGNPMLEGWLAVPLVGRTGRRLGLIQVADKVDADFTESDEAVLVHLAQLAAVAIENAARFQHEHDVAQALQRSLLPRHLPVVPGIELAVRYQPGAAGTQVGGDWYDAVPLDDGRLAITVGDVMGRGPRAAAVMGQVRTALRAYALQNLPATVIMRSLDRLVQDIGDDAMATAALLVIDQQEQRLEVISAGHPPPLLVSPEGDRRFLEGDPHAPLGVVEAPVYQPLLVPYDPGTLLLLYTDGLVEERDEHLDEGFARLARCVDAAATDLERLCDHVLATMVPVEKNDDIALLAARVGLPL